MTRDTAATALLIALVAAVMLLVVALAPKPVAPLEQAPAWDDIPACLDCGVRDV